ncbi:unnamed protein product [Amoebophrya sp. A120]|nr:unnamed protein product [Amoebophrya sp. A120]|eukprot:GSA120T00012047001.1
MSKEFVEEAARYLEGHEAYFLLRDLMKDLIKEQPADPLAFLVQRLEAPSQILLCMLAPPGLSGDKHAEQVASSFGLTCVNVDAAVDDSKSTADADAIACVKSALESAPSDSKGCLLYGFPKTKVQARALQNMRKIPDSVCIVTGDSKTIKNHLLKSAPGATAEEKADAVESQLQIYLRHIHSVAEIFKNAAVEVSVTGSTSVVDQVQHAVARAVADPRGPLRMCVLGPLGSGRSTQAARIAEDFGVVHVDVNTMVSKPAESVTDEELCEKVGDRLRQADCLRRGWVLDGFPQTEHQASYLKKAHLWPSRVVHLTVPESVCLQRLSIRRVDPATGEYYYGNAPQLAVRQRLVQAAADSPDQVSTRYHYHYDRCKQVLSHFPGIATSIRGQQQPTDILQAIRDFVMTAVPLP